MPEWFFDWSGWLFGLIGAIGVVITWVGLTQRRTSGINTAVNSIGVDQDAKGGGQNTAKGSAGVKQKS
jgi:hypothetical protein